MFYKKIMLSLAALSLNTLGKIQADEPLLSDRTKILLTSFGKGLAHGATNRLGNHAIDSLAKEDSKDKRENYKQLLSLLSFMAYRKTETAQKKVAPLNYISLMGIGLGMEHAKKQINTMNDQYAHMLLATAITAATVRTLDTNLQELTQEDNAELLAHGVGQLMGESIKIEKNHKGELRPKASLNLNLTLTVGLISTFYKYCFPTK